MKKTLLIALLATIISALSASAVQDPLEFVRSQIGAALLQSSYEDGDKYILGLSITGSTHDSSKYGAAMQLWIDLDDYFAVTQEGSEAEPWVTIWVTVDLRASYSLFSGNIGPLGMNLVQLEGFCEDRDMGDGDIIGDFGQFYDYIRVFQKLVDVTYDGEYDFYWFDHARTLNVSPSINLQGGYKFQLMKADIKKSVLDQYLSDSINLGKLPGQSIIPLGLFGDAFGTAGFFQALMQPGNLRPGLTARSDLGPAPYENGIVAFSPYLPYQEDYHGLEVIVQNANQGWPAGANFKLVATPFGSLVPDPLDDEAYEVPYEIFWLGLQDAISRTWWVGFDGTQYEEGDLMFTLYVQDIGGAWHEVDQKPYHMIIRPEPDLNDVSIASTCTQDSIASYTVETTTGGDSAVSVGSHLRVTGGTIAGVVHQSGVNVFYYDPAGNVVQLTDGPVVCEIVSAEDSAPFNPGYIQSSIVSISWDYGAPSKSIEYRGWALDGDSYSRDYSESNTLLRISRSPYNTATAPDYSKHAFDPTFAFTDYAVHSLDVELGPPVAGIHSISPSSITQGDGDVAFDGSSSTVTTPGTSITTYRWTSNRDGQLYEGGNSSFTRDSDLLSADQHTISLQVRDSNGLWSQTSAQGTLNVYEPGPDEGHDLRIDSITLDENVVAVNHDFAVDVMISNDGDYTEDSFTILYTLRNESGGIMDQETESAWSLAAGRTQGPGWVYLDPSSGYQGPVRIEVTINTPLDEDRSNNDGTASGYVGTLPAYDGYYGASWNYAPGGSDIVEGSYRIRPLYDSGSRVTVEVVKGADSWTGDINWDGVALFDQNRLAVAYYGRNSNPSYYGFGIFQYNESAVWLSDEHVTTYEGEQCEFIVNRQSDSSTYCSDWYISSSGDGSTVRTWSHDDERIDNITRRLWITPPNDAVGHYDFWLANCWSWGGSSYDGTTKRLDNGLGVIASLTVYADDPPNTVINSGQSGTNAQNSATFGYGGSDDRTAVGSLTYSYRLLGHQDSWSSYASATSKSYSDLTNGSYTFEVRAKDTKGQVDPSPAQREFTVDVQNPPSTPANVTPSHLASVRGTSEIALQGNAFNDTDPGATHQASEFLVRLDTGNYTSPAWNSGILGALTTATIPAGDLPQGTYWWQCRYRDNTDRWSEPSGETSFTILENHAPSAEARTVSVVHDRSVAISLPASDPNGDPVTCSMLSDPTSGGTVVSNGSLNATYTPPASFVGTDTFTYQVTDGLLDSSVATVTVDVVNHSPYANTVLVVVESGERTTLSLPGGDADGDGLSYTIDAPPDNGTLFTDDLANGNIDYQSAPGFNADDALTYSISDGIATDTGTVSLVVSDPNNMTIDLVEDALGRLAVKYPAIAGFTYRVQYCNALSEDWQDLASGTVGDGAMRLKPDTTAEMPQSRMYRIIVETP